MTPKTKNLVLLLLMCFSLNSFSQESKLQLAFITTPQVSWINSDNSKAERDGIILGYSLGIQGDYFFAKNYAISTSLLYSKLGGKLSYATSFPMQVGGEVQTIGAGESVRYGLSYIEIPIGLKLKTKEFRRNTFWAQAGISPMVNVSAVNRDKNDISENINLFNFGYHFGIGTDYSLGGSTFLTGALMLSNGITDITRGAFEDKASMSTINLRVGVIF